jgi:four helix bundle protein
LTITRAATSISLNIVEGSTGQSDAEQNRFLGMALLSLIETVACQRLIARRKYLSPNDPLAEKADLNAQTLARKLHSFRKSLKIVDSRKFSEQTEQYPTENEDIQ